MVSINEFQRSCAKKTHTHTQNKEVTIDRKEKLLIRLNEEKLSYILIPCPSLRMVVIRLLKLVY